MLRNFVAGIFSYYQTYPHNLWISGRFLMLPPVKSCLASMRHLYREFNALAIEDPTGFPGGSSNLLFLQRG